jgi:hypothetical protein
MRPPRRWSPAIAGALFLLLLGGCGGSTSTGAPPPAGPGASTGPAQGSGVPAQPPSPAAAAPDFSLFVGEWNGHGAGLTIRADGTFKIEMRTYHVCGQDPPPCDDMSGQQIVDGIQASGKLDKVSGNVATGRILTTTDPAGTPTGPVTFTLDPSNDTISGAGANFCGKSAPVDTCGA